MQVARDLVLVGDSTVDVDGVLGGDRPTIRPMTMLLFSGLFACR